MAITNVKNIFTTYTLDNVTETKNYHRVLFKPGVSVQARELTEMQTNLQRQIDYHGQYSFTDGSRVVDGQVVLNNDYDYIKVESTMTTGGTTYTASSFINTVATPGTILTGANNVQAEVIQVITESGVDQNDNTKTGILESGFTSDALTIYVKYIQGSGGTASNVFAAGEILTASTNAAHKLMIGGGTDVDGSGTDSTGAVATNPIGKGSEVSINEGVYFISGNFVHVAADSIILEKYDTTPSNIIGLNITETIATSVDDVSLVDNAAGFPNVTAPGADRYKIATQLIKEPLASPNSAYTNYFILLKVDNGIRQAEVAPAAAVDVGLTKRLARRTEEESGNYALKPFTLDIKEYLDDGTNGGYKTNSVIETEESLNAANAKIFGEKKYVVGIEPNVAYVQGYRTENISPTFITVDKPREATTLPYDYAVKDNVTTRLDIGNYVKIDISSASTSVGFPDIENFSEMALIDTSGGATTPIALVDTVALGSAAGTFQGTYYVTDGDAHTTGANGTGARFKIVIDSAGKVVVEVIDGGNGYNVNSLFTVLGTKFTGGATTANDLTFRVAQLGVGRARARAVVYESATVMRLYLFDVVMTSGVFSAVDKVEQLDEVTGGAAVNEFFGHFVAADDGKRFDAENNSLVFPLPFSGLKTVQPGNDKPAFTYQKRLYVDDAGGTSHQFTSVLGANETIVGNTAIISVGSGTGTNVRTTTAPISVSGTAVTIDNSLLDDRSACAIITIQKSAAVDGLKVKSFHTITDTEYKFDGTNPILLNAYDIYDIVSVKQGATDGPDITREFKLDDGQRANFYDEGRLIPIGNLPAGSVYITFHHYKHSVGQYITMDSYTGITDAYHDIDAIPLAVIPQGTFDLKDCIDFRPVKSVIDVHSNVYAGINDSTFHTEDSSGKLKGINALALSPGSILTFDAHIWLPRIDKLVLGRDGAYSVIKGVTAESPVAPEDPRDSMTVGTLNISPFTYNAKNNIGHSLNDHKRYTMRHIGEINKRVKNLEYYTSLSLLESATLGVSIPEGDTERFKNGIFVEPFIGHSNANVEHPDYHCSIDKSIGALRPKFDEQNVNMIKSTVTGGTNLVKLTGSLYTLPFTSQTFIDQPAATLTEFVNPYNVFTWNGVIRLSPDSDEWKDVDHRPDVLINETGQYDQMVGMLEESGVLGTVWNEWETNWTGTDRDIQSFGHQGRWADGDMTAANFVQVGGFNEWGGYKYKSGTITTTTTTTNQSISGLNTSIVTDTETKELGSKVVETNYIPFIRSREIFFRAEMLKPNTKLYAFFNDVNVTSYCAEKTFVEFATASNVSTFTDATVHPGGSPGVLVSDSSGIIEGSFIIPNNSALSFKTGTREFRLTDSSANDKLNEGTFAETEYHAQGLLEVKQNTIVSTKVPRIVTSEVNDTRVITDSRVNDNTKTKWYDPLAQTILINQEGGIFATELDIFIAATEVGTAATGAGIPLNVSIRETENGIPTQRIVPGSETLLYPSSITTPSNAADVVKNLIYTNHVSATGAVPCPVTFEHPVYLSEDVEYAIVLISNSDTYKVCVAETGGIDLITNARVAKQPYNGVFFKSQNGSTWTPDQGKDLKFKLKRAEFSNSGSTITFVNDQLPVKKLKADPFTVCSQSTATAAFLRVSHPNHGMMEGSKVTIAGSTALFTNRVVVGQINGTHSISDVERDSYVIGATTGITAANSGLPVAYDGLIAGGATVTATENMTIDALVPYNETLQLPETSITCSAGVFSSRSQDNSTQGIYTGSANIPLSINKTNYFESPIVIASGIEHTTGTGGLGSEANITTQAGKTIGITCKFSTSNTFLSPVIDANRSSIFCISNRTNDATNNAGGSAYNKTTHGRTYVADTAARHNSNLNNYITKEITLANEATQIDAYAEVHRPSGSSIDLYYKVQSSGDDTDFNDLPWIALAPKEAIAVKDIGVTHVEFTKTPADSFSSFAFKIVLTTNNSAKVPMVKNFRSIATT